MTLKDFLLDRIEEERKLTREWPAHLAAAAYRDLKAKLVIVDLWPDPMGQWTAEQADAARTMKQNVLWTLASAYASHPDYGKITDAP